jgi:hypothetical protein
VPVWESPAVLIAVGAAAVAAAAVVAWTLKRR